MSLCKVARQHLGLTQEKFAEYLSERTGRKVYTSLIGKYESRRTSICEEYRMIMLPLAVDALAEKIATIDSASPDFRDKLHFMLANVI